MTSEICWVRLERAAATSAGVTIDVARGRQLQHELVPDLGLEVVGHEGRGGSRVIPGVLARAGTEDRRRAPRSPPTTGIPGS